MSLMMLIGDILNNLNLNSNKGKNIMKLDSGLKIPCYRISPTRYRWNSIEEKNLRNRNPWIEDVHVIFEDVDRDEIYKVEKGRDIIYYHVENEILAGTGKTGQGICKVKHILKQQVEVEEDIIYDEETKRFYTWGRIKIEKNKKL